MFDVCLHDCQCQGGVEKVDKLSMSLEDLIEPDT